MSTGRRIEKLEALLARIQWNAATPRVATLSGTGTGSPVALQVAEPSVHRPPPEPPPYSPPQPSPDLAVASGEFDISDVPLELEELGPADEALGDDESMIEIEVGDPAIETISRDLATADFLSAADPDDVGEHADLLESGPPPRPEREDEPPASGPEVVGSPRESARVPVAAPSAASEDEISLEPATPREGTARDHDAAVSAPVQIVTAVGVHARGLPSRPIEGVTVAIAAAEIRPGVTPNDVAAFVGAARAPRPESFGVLLDAALDL